MRSRDYTRELKLAPSNARVPLPVTIIVFVGVALTGAMFVKQVLDYQPSHEAMESGAPVQAMASNHH